MLDVVPIGDHGRVGDTGVEVATAHGVLRQEYEKWHSFWFR